MHLKYVSLVLNAGQKLEENMRYLSFYHTFTQPVTRVPFR